MDFKVIYQPLALDDLEAIVRHVAKEDLQATNGRLGMYANGKPNSCVIEFASVGGHSRSRSELILDRTPHLSPSPLGFCDRCRSHPCGSIREQASHRQKQNLRKSA